MSEITTLHHLWGNPIAAIDVETTGSQVGYHEIIQIGIVPMDMDLQIADVKPFNYTVKPIHPKRADPKAMKTNGLNLDELILNAPSKARVLDFLVEWFHELPMGVDRRLTPLAFNWAFERAFLIDWLGEALMDRLFTVLPRDPMLFALSLNDRANMLHQDAPFPRVNLPSMCQQYGIEQRQKHNALSDAQDTARLYNAMMRSIIR